MAFKNVIPQAFLGLEARAATLRLRLLSVPCRNWWHCLLAALRFRGLLAELLHRLTHP
jgi:hypothetical protein